MMILLVLLIIGISCSNCPMPLCVLSIASLISSVSYSVLEMRLDSRIPGKNKIHALKM